MTVISKNPDIGLRPLLRFSQQFLNTDQTKPDLILKENIEKLVRVFAGELQELEDALVDIMYNLCVFDIKDSDGNTLVNQAYGKSLDLIAAVVGAEPRQGMTDDQYRAEIALQIAINTSMGNIHDVTDALKKITQGTVIEWTDDFPAGINFVTNGNYAGREVLDQITQILSAAVGFSIAYRDDSVGVFEFSDGLVNCIEHIPVSVTNSSTSATLTNGDERIKVGTVIVFGYDTSVSYTVTVRTGNTITLNNAYAGATNTEEYLNIKSGANTYHPSYQRYKAWADTYSTLSIPADVTNGSGTVNLDAADAALITNGDTVYFEYDPSVTYSVTAVGGTSITISPVYAGFTDTPVQMFVHGVNTASVTDGSATVTIDTSYDYLIFAGDRVFFDFDSSNNYVVESVSSGTITLKEEFNGNTNANASLFVVRRNKTLTGTCSVTSGNNTVTINNSVDYPKVMVGDIVVFGGQNTYYEVATTTGTGFTLTTNYSGSTNASISCAVYPHSGAFLDILT